MPKRNSRFLKKQCMKIERYMRQNQFSKLRKVRETLEKNDNLEVFLTELNTLEKKPGTNYLQHLCNTGRITAVNTFLDLGADVGVTNQSGSNCLHIALNYVLENFDWKFFHEAVFRMVTSTSESELKAKNQYGESAEKMLTEILDVLLANQSQYTIESEDENESEENWNEKLFFEMQADDPFSNESYMQEEHIDTFRYQETYSEWGDRMRTEYEKKHVRYKPVHSVGQSRSQGKRERQSKETGQAERALGPKVTKDLLKRFRIIEAREIYEEKCRLIFSSDGPQKITFQDVPWPVEPSENYKDVLSNYVQDTVDFFTYGFDEEEKKRYLKQQRIRWHPDRFKQKCIDKLDGTETNQILELVNTIAQTVNAVLAERES